MASIGAALDVCVSLSHAQRSAQHGHGSTLSGAAPTGARGTDFEALLDAQLRAHAAAKGYALPGTDAPTATGGSQERLAVPESADAIWQRVRIADMARNGQADAIMDSISRAADARWERERTGRSSSGFEELLGL